MILQRAISTLGCEELNLAGALALAARHRLDGLELRALGGTLDLPDHFAREFGSPAALAAALAPPAVRIVALDTSLRLTEAGAGVRAELLRFVPWAEAAGARWLRVFDGECQPGAPGAAPAVEVVRWWQAVRRQQGWRVDLVVETHDALLDSGRICAFAAAAPGVRLLWDTHHTWKLGGEDPVATWRAIGRHVAHIHVKDSVPEPGPRHPFTYVLPGAGGFPMAALGPVLREEYRGLVCLEWERRWHPDLPPLEAALAAAAARHWW